MTRPLCLARNSTPLPEFSQETTRNLLNLLTLSEAARELRCSRKHLSRLLQGQVPDLPPLPVFRLGRRRFIRSAMLHAWITNLEAREREDRYATGFCGLRDDELEFIAGA